MFNVIWLDWFFLLSSSKIPRDTVILLLSDIYKSNELPGSNATIIFAPVTFNVGILFILNK